MLDLSNNKITSPIPVLNMPCLSELILDNNSISELKFLSERQMIPMMRLISVGGCEELVRRNGNRLVI